jgi:uncharacterized OB-fold protein
VTSPYWEAAGRGELRIARCTGCGLYIHFPEPVCHRCGGTALEWARVSGDGTVYTFTVVAHQFFPGHSPPYVVAWIELEEQKDLRVLATLVDVDPDAVTIGMPVAAAFAPAGDDVVLPVFRPR